MTRSVRRGHRQASVDYQSLDKRRERENSSDTVSSDGDSSADDERSSHPAPRPATNASSPLLLLVGVLLVALAAGAFVLFLYKRDKSAAPTVPSASETLTQVTTVPVMTEPSAPTVPQDNDSPSSAPSPSSPSASPASSPSLPPASSVSSAPSAFSTTAGTIDQSKLKALGISTFLGNLTGAIASWYHTDSSTDSTNGRSWCELSYDDDVPGFAPSLKTMLSSFNSDATAAKKAFCGLKATVYSPKTGRQVPMIIADAFDDKWVRTPNSIDVIYGSFPELFGSTTDNKDDVVKDVWWMLTGERDEKFTYKGTGVG